MDMLLIEPSCIQFRGHYLRLLTVVLDELATEYNML